MKATEAPQSESDHIAQELRTLWHGIIRASERASHLDRQQFWVLAALEPAPQRMTALAEQALTSQASLTGIVDRLEDRGLVERVRSSEDRRVVEVSLRDSGRVELSRARAVFAEQLETKFAPLSAEERFAFLGVLRKLNSPAPDHSDLG